MEYTELMQAVLTTILIPMLSVIGIFIVKLIQKKFDEIEINNKNAELQKYIDMTELLIIDAVIETNQTFVEALKADGNFTEEDALLALTKTRDNILLLLTRSAKEAITEIYGDFDKWLDLKIQSVVNQTKVTPIVEAKAIIPCE